ncbi:hypothetical protein [Stenotrophomonas maltophilia]|uniref:hypothetical protein n=1 Tax=Stenotrophomonas maltophilia TaxID=40324 RepID=UPI001F531F9D|nr:hypothetical protein [Stenotrophomonas maltophilia]MCI1124297.1 hypothetical protein [Stenotrophomonas maltophilia]
MYNPFEELNFVGIHDAGVANLERVVLQANRSVELANYMVVAALRGHGQSAIPLPDNSIWLGNLTVSPGDWIYIYTSPGQGQVTPLPNSSNQMVSLYWGKSHTMFQAAHLTAALVKINKVQYPTFSPHLTLGTQQLGYSGHSL